MMDRVMTELSYAVFGEDWHQRVMEVERVNCHHNFTQIENHFGENVWVTRLDFGRRADTLCPGSGLELRD
jgi:tRNA-splicing ligase RtcB